MDILSSPPGCGSRNAQGNEMGLSADLNAKLKAIGAFTHDDNTWEWDAPTALRDRLPSTSLTMINESGEDLDDVFDRLLSAYSTVLKDGERLLQQAQSLSVQVFRDSYIGQLPDEEVAKYRNAGGEIEDSLVAASVKVTSITLIADDDDVFIDIDCSCDWDQEHGLPLSFCDGVVDLRM